MSFSLVSFPLAMFYLCLFASLILSILSRCFSFTESLKVVLPGQPPDVRLTTFLTKDNFSYWTPW